MSTHTTLVTTPDGPMTLHKITPSAGGGPWPAVIFCIDGGGLRPSLFAMAQRIADAGYAVFAPDLFHRSGSVFDLLPAGAAHDAPTFLAHLADPAFRQVWRETFFDRATRSQNLVNDLTPVFEALDVDPDVARGPVATTGYCMGGQISLKLAGLIPQRVGAAASFHGGFLATDSPDSAHLFAPQIKARVYIGAASDDPSFPDAMQARLVKALDDANVRYSLARYAAQHGFCIPDFPTFDADASERHYGALFALLRDAR